MCAKKEAIGAMTQKSQMAAEVLGNFFLHPCEEVKKDIYDLRNFINFLGITFLRNFVID